MLIILHYRWLSLIILHYPSLSLIIVDYHWLSLIIIDYHWLSLIIIDYHWLSLIIIDYHWLSENSKLSISGWLTDNLKSRDASASKNHYPSGPAYKWVTPNKWDHRYYINNSGSTVINWQWRGNKKRPPSFHILDQYKWGSNGCLFSYP